MANHKSKLNIALVQMTSIDDVDSNWSQIQKVTSELFEKHQSVDLICFPENALYLRLKEKQKIVGLKKDDKIFQDLADLAVKKNVALHIGASPVEIENQLYNSSIYISKLGEFKFSYQKIHLFDIQLKGQAPLRESDVFTAGTKPSILNIEGWSFGESICYDIRFSELYSFYAKNHVDVILVPAAFLTKTGQAHWQILLRARAIESQCYVLASAQAGLHKNADGASRETYGHSMVVSPWGDVQELKTDGIGYVFTVLEKEKINHVREQIPMSLHRKI